MASVIGGRNAGPKARAKVKGQPSEAFLVKCAKEREKLRRQLDADLRHSMQQLLTGGNFTDLTLTTAADFGSNRTSSDLQVHSAILKARVPHFYQTNCKPRHTSSVTLAVEKKQITSFMRKVYCEDDIRIEEITINNAIERSNNQLKPKNDVSPSYCGDSSDTYLTPLSSLPNIPEAFEKEQIQHRKIIPLNYCGKMADPKVPQEPIKGPLGDVQANASKEQRDIKVINSLFTKVKDETNISESLTDSGFLSQTTSVHDEQPSDGSQQSKATPVYMYVDINNVQAPPPPNSAVKRNQDPNKPRAVSMFIDFNDAEKAANQNEDGEPVLRRANSYKITSPERKVNTCRHGIYVPSEPENSKKDSKPSKKIDDELLLPMSPIMRRKNQRTDASKPEIKASIRPQDVDSFTITKRTVGNEPQKTSTENAKSTVLSPLSDDSPDDRLVHGESNEALSSPPESQKPTAIPCTITTDLSSQVPSDFEEDTETIYSEISDLSSIGGLSTSTVTLHSSKKGSNGGRTPDEDRRKEYRLRGPCSKLGEDLLRMFLEEINTDVVIEVADRQIKAHRCILSSRCQYFSAMWRNKNVAADDTQQHNVKLPGFSYNGIHFALCHIYSGATNIPDNTNLPELALIAEMLGLDGLKDVIIFHLKMSYCHFFHKPCSTCTIGVCQCLPISATYGLTELHDKSLKWIGKHFVKVWPNKAFATLPQDLIDKCYHTTLTSMSADNVIEMILSCDAMSSVLPQQKWSETVFTLISRLITDCTKFISERFDALLSNDNFFILGKGMSWNVTAVEDIIMSAVDNISADVACRSYIILNRILPLAEASDCSSNMQWTENFLNLLKKINRECERYLIHNANRVAHCSSWPLLGAEVQHKITDAAVIVFEFGKPTAAPPRLTSLNRSFSKKHKPTKQVTNEAPVNCGTYDKTTRQIECDAVAKTTQPPAPQGLDLEIKSVTKPEEQREECTQPTASPKQSKRVAVKPAAKSTKTKSPPPKPPSPQKNIVSPDSSESMIKSEVSSVTSSEWDVNELTSKSIKEAELLENALTKKLESQNIKNKPVNKKNGCKMRPVSSPAVPSNQEMSRMRMRPRTTAKVAPTVGKVQTTKVSGTLRVTKESTYQRRPASKPR